MTMRPERFGSDAPRRIAAITMIAGLFLLAAFHAAWATPKSQLWDRWTRHDDNSDLTIDHSAWTRFLADYVRKDATGASVVAYGSVTEAARKSLDAYIERLSIAPVDTYSRRVQLAYWINLFNALTMRVVLDYYPVKSIRDIDISPGWFVDGPWDRVLVEVEGAHLTLNDIEHRILRPIWNDPRIHYALFFASRGGGNLAMRAFTGATVDAMLDAAARMFVNSPRAVAFDGDRARVNAMYKWYQDDFGGSPIRVLIHLRKYAAPALHERLGLVKGIEGYDYDWSLNADAGATEPRDEASRESGRSALLR